ncbi:hypothetical protein LCGC14_2031700 [marine sediment metagenome]|uniref:DNA methylase N-4/N-6 domain-containing protein n=1 Tax=marine sediment metagenome TaxID=412755 RepID=A0A0F9HRK2_9ZZZZ
MTVEICRGHCVDLLQQETRNFDLIVTDPPYAFGGTGDEHALSASVAIGLRGAASRLNRGRWMLVACASSWRSTIYMVEALRGVLEPVRIGHWGKPVARTKARTPGWAWASVNVIAFRKGKAKTDSAPLGTPRLDHIICEPLKVGRRAELPPEVAEWMVAPFAVAGGMFLDPFCGSGALVRAASQAQMRAVGYEKGVE